MHILTGQHLKEATGRYREAAKQIAAWRSVAKDKHWHNPGDVSETFADTEFSGDYVIFHVHQNKYRLVTTIHYSRDNGSAAGEGHVWIRSFLTQKQYENPAHWDQGVPR